MTDTLINALEKLDSARSGYVLAGADGSPLTDNETKYHCYRLCRLAGLPPKAWHRLRHTFGTHSAMFGVNPWKLMQWLGHKRIDETMLYVHVAGVHLRPIPKKLIEAGARHDDPDRRVIAMLSERRETWPECQQPVPTSLGTTD